jgi:hypothetical protein
MKQRLRLGKKRTLNERTLCEVLRLTFELEALNIGVALSGRLRKVSD